MFCVAEFAVHLRALGRCVALPYCQIPIRPCSLALGKERQDSRRMEISQYAAWGFD
jgi:hypothetical protein